MTHEIGHMFGIKHCQWFNCVMQGSNHLEESDRRPLDFCPICLRKTQSAVGFKIAERYKVQETLVFQVWSVSYISSNFLLGTAITIVNWGTLACAFIDILTWWFPFLLKFNSNQKISCSHGMNVSSTGLIAVDGGGSNYHTKGLFLSVWPPLRQTHGRFSHIQTVASQVSRHTRQNVTSCF